MNVSQIQHGQKFKVIITLDCELVTDTPGATHAQIRDLFWKDEAYGLKSIVAGKINPECGDTHDTEITWDCTTIEIA